MVTRPRSSTRASVTLNSDAIAIEALNEALARSKCKYVFTNETGLGVFSENRITRAFDKAKKIAGITRHVRFHDFGRHTFASNLGSAGASELLIAGLLGHTDTHLVKRYTRLNDAAINVTADLLNKINERRVATDEDEKDS